jgi:hypothetical protein
VSLRDVIYIWISELLALARSSHQK